MCRLSSDHIGSPTAKRNQSFLHGQRMQGLRFSYHGRFLLSNCWLLFGINNCGASEYVEAISCMANS
jgi:hypothetical protein